jgi:hypothetical protein
MHQEPGGPLELSRLCDIPLIYYLEIPAAQTFTGVSTGTLTGGIYAAVVMFIPLPGRMASAPAINGGAPLVLNIYRRSGSHLSSQALSNVGVHAVGPNGITITGVFLSGSTLAANEGALFYSTVALVLDAR